MKKLFFLVIYMITISVAEAQQQPAIFPKIVIGSNGTGRAIGVGYVMDVPIMSLQPSVTVHIFMVNPQGMIVENILTANIWPIPSNWNDLSTGSDGHTYKVARTVKVGIKSTQLKINGVLMNNPDGTPAIESEEVTVSF